MEHRLASSSPARWGDVVASVKGKKETAVLDYMPQATSDVKCLQMTQSYASTHFQLPVSERTLTLSVQSVFKQYTTTESDVGSNSGEEWFDLEYVS